MNSHHSTSPDVYAFFDISTCHYEVYRTDIFHHLFPWYLCGAKFDADLARFEHHPVVLGAMDVSLWRGFCVPQVFSRWTTGEDGSLAKTKLVYDEWMLPKTAEPYEPECWESDTSVMEMSGMNHSYLTLPDTTESYGPEFWEVDASWMDTSSSGIAPPSCTEFQRLKDELLDCGYDLPSYPELRSLRDGFHACGSKGLLKPPPFHEFMEERGSLQVSNRDGWASLELNAKYLHEQ